MYDIFEAIGFVVLLCFLYVLWDISNISGYIFELSGKNIRNIMQCLKVQGISKGRQLF